MSAISFSISIKENGSSESEGTDEGVKEVMELTTKLRRRASINLALPRHAPECDIVAYA